MIFIHLEHKIELSFIKNTLFRCEIKLQYSKVTLWTRIVILDYYLDCYRLKITIVSCSEENFVKLWYLKITILRPLKFLKLWKFSKSGSWKFRNCYFDIRNLASSEKSQMVKRAMWNECALGVRSSLHVAYTKWLWKKINWHTRQVQLRNQDHLCRKSTCQAYLWPTLYSRSLHLKNWSKWLIRILGERYSEHNFEANIPILKLLW